MNLRERTLRGILEPWKGWLRKHAGVEWQRGFFDHRLRGETAIREKADYVLLNPVRKDLAATAEEWPWKQIAPG